jgi:hypothetical protein
VFGAIGTWRALRTTSPLAVVLIPLAVVITLGGIAFVVVALSM